MSWTWQKVVLISVIVIGVGGLSYLCGERDVKRIVGYTVAALACIGIGRKALPELVSRIASKRWA